MAKAKDDVIDNEDAGFDTFGGAEGGESLMVNLSEVKEMSFDPIPKGSYLCVLEQCDYEISKSSGKPMWNTRWSVVDGEYENRKLFMYISFSEKALPMTKTNISRFAPELLETAFDPKLVADRGDLLGKTALLKVKIEKGQDGDDRNAVQRIEAAEGAGDDDFGGGF